ncbi:toxin-antitoxin system YwqK family antitoxin, partial [Arcobacter sp. CECT 8985]|uniref:toxin-antitoxin system YwqK family antitoxin n=1 Tax=Arcobacter sp. CECT 8985 TaxID=1935424 RepID=UPI00100AB0BF
IYTKNYIKSTKEYNRKGVLIKSYEYNFDKNEGLEKEYYIDGALKSTVKYNKRGYRLSQTLKKFNENTHKSISTKIVNGKKEGKEIVYDSNGDLKRISNYKNGKIKSIEYESGLVSKITNYKNGKLDGEEKRYLGGYLSSITYYKNGKKLKYKSFTYDKYSFARGILQRYEEYSNGYLDGVVKIYNNLGLLKEYKEYKDGKLNGVVKTYNSDGILEQYEEYKNDILDGITKRYDVAGNILYVVTYKEGKLNGNYKKYFYDNPNVLKEKGSYKNDKLNGYVESYYKNKQLKSKILYTNGEEDYTDIQNYYKNGNKKSIAFKKNNNINFKNYYENGKILSIGTVNKITNNSELKEYHPNSQLAKHIKIVNGKEVINKKYNNKGDEIE